METKIEEIWKDVVGFEGYYQVSSLGRIKNIKRNKLLHPHRNRHGYLRFCLKKPGMIVRQKNIPGHRIVALAFIPNPENKPQVNHINLIKYDNRLENLEWCTASENMKHSSLHGAR